ncbi:MAG TPA: monooxygenase, partial [Sorangium sp.]|nr:monooxygenase [Sorangium sp.]
DPAVVHEAAIDPSQWMSNGKPFTIHTGGLHMHTRGTKASLGVRHQGGQDECLIDIPRWDFDWQFGYAFTEPVSFQPGDLLTLRCQWDNSPSNQPSIGGQPMPPQALAWGDGTNDEMCLATIYITVD